MKKKLLYFFILIPAFIITACNPSGLIERHTSGISIDTGLVLSRSGSRAVQSDVASFKITVAANDMETVERIFTEQVINLEIEAGPARKFTLAALDSSSNELFAGSTTVDLTAGENITISIEMDYSGFYVSFETNGAGTISTLYVEDNGLVPLPAAPSKTGFSLAGWYKDAGFTTPWNFSSDTVTADMTLYAKWLVGSPVTGVSLNNSSLTLTNSNLSSLAATIEPADALDQTISWSSSNTSVLSVSGTGATPTLSPQGSGIATITATTNDGSFTDSCTISVTLYSVTYFANGGIGTPPNDTNQYLMNGSATVENNTLTNGSLIFQSWNTQSDGNGTNYFPTQPLPISGNMELHAIWIADDHGNAYSSATSISYPSNTAGNIQYDGDVDYFSISLPGPGQLVLDSIGGSTDVTATLYDTDGTTSLEFDDDDGGSLMFLIDYSIQSAGTYYIRVAGFSTNIGPYTLNVSFTPFSVGGIGPGGGYIFYDQGSYIGGWRYMEAYPVDLGTYAYAANGNGNDVTSTLSGVGEGLNNTALIVSQRVTDSDTGTAAQICDSDTGYGFSDWYLPSYDELNLMYTELYLNSLGSFSAQPYWSSTDTENDDCAWALDFSSGTGASSGNWHSNGLWVRPARRF